MKTHQPSASILFTLAMMIGMGMKSASAQSTTDSKNTTQPVIALSQDGTSFKAPTYLRVNIYPLIAATFL